MNQTLPNCSVLSKRSSNGVIWNGLEVNKAKCKIITYSKSDDFIKHKYNIKNRPFNRVNKTKNLGVFVDKKLNFSAHIAYVIKRAKEESNFIKTHCSDFDSYAKHTLYVSLMGPMLKTSCAVWSPCSKHQKKEIENIQNDMMMFLNSVKYHLPTLVRRRLNVTAIFMHKIVSMGNLRQIIFVNMWTVTMVSELTDSELIQERFDRCFVQACLIFNHVTRYIDPTLPLDDFKRKLVKLPHYAFGPWANIDN